MKYSTVLSSLLSIVGAGKSSASLSENDNSALILQTMRPNPEPYSITYEDGTESPLLFIKIRGDEDRVRGNDEAPLVYEETIDGFTVQPSAAQGGKYTYFDIDVETGDLIDTGLVAGEANPELMKVHKHAATMSEDLKVPNNAHPDFKDDHHSRNLRGSKLSVDEDFNTHHRRTEITSGVMNNLVVPIRFSDHTTRLLPSRGDLEVLMNNNGAATQCPTGSVRDVFKQSSFGKLDLQSTVVDWITIDYTEAQCANGNSGLTTFIHTCLTNALDKLRDDGFNFGDLDEDNDGVSYSKTVKLLYLLHF